MQNQCRHQCLIYQGSPSRNLPALVSLLKQKLDQNHRCLHLDSPPMICGFRSYLAAAGVDVAHEAELSIFLLMLIDVRKIRVILSED